MKKTAFITGMTGQDGPYLAKLLIDKGYKVYGLIKRYSNPNLDNMKYLGIDQDVDLLVGDITDENSIANIIRSIKPDEIYNLAAQSFVGASWDLNKVTTEVNSIGPLNILNAIKMHSPTSRFYQASTSEMFGNADTPIQNENTPFRPRSPYGVAKLYAHWITVNFRESYGLYACSGILFNHESPIRGKEFVTRKITDAIARIKLGLDDSISLGNLDAMRDWGFAGDYVEMMWRMLQQDVPDDYVIATGKTHTIRELLDIGFNHVGIPEWEKFIKTDHRYIRPAELHLLCGDASKAERQLGWKPTTTFKQLIEMMVDADIKRYQKMQ